MAKLEFELILRITGESLDEIDQGLTQAAGERLHARILAKTQDLNKPTQPPPGLNIKKDKNEAHS